MNLNLWLHNLTKINVSYNCISTSVIRKEITDKDVDVRISETARNMTKKSCLKLVRCKQVATTNIECTNIRHDSLGNTLFIQLCPLSDFFGYMWGSFSGYMAVDIYTNKNQLTHVHIVFQNASIKVRLHDQIIRAKWFVQVNLHRWTEFSYSVWVLLSACFGKENKFK